MVGSVCYTLRWTTPTTSNPGYGAAGGGDRGGDGSITPVKSPTPPVVLGKAILFVEEAEDGYVALKRE
ncbi:MAG TPA: hypothetical protein VMC61_00950 [Methanocella sp.]|nr:hypothetical protein [Methanocella sp.]